MGDWLPLEEAARTLADQIEEVRRGTRHTLGFAGFTVLLDPSGHGRPQRDSRQVERDVYDANLTLFYENGNFVIEGQHNLIYSVRALRPFEATRYAACTDLSENYGYAAELRLLPYLDMTDFVLPSRDCLFKD